VSVSRVVAKQPGTASLTARSPRAGANANQKQGRWGAGPAGALCVCGGGGGVRAAAGTDTAAGPDITGAAWLDVTVTQRAV